VTSTDTWVSVSTPYVKPRQPGQPDAWAQEAAEHGHTGTHRLREVAEVQPPAQVAAALQQSPHEPAVVRRRVVLLDGQPVELADSYYPAAIARGTRLAEQRKIPGGAPTLLASLGHDFRPPCEDIAARFATAAERELLNLTEPTPVLELTRTITNQDGVPVEVSVMTMLPGRRLRYQLGGDDAATA
jgi:DNA-binding GntR family transcriptional regulator